MNERIQKLMEESGLYIAYENKQVTEKELEFFAELIVRECLEQIDKIRDGCEADSEFQSALGADWAGLAVARHFGVE